MRRLAGVFVLLLTLVSPAYSADPPIRLTIYPRFQHGPGTIRVTLIVQRNPLNRGVCISIEGDTGYSRSSCWDHVGEGARYETVFYYPDLPAGHYAAQATVIRVSMDGKREEVLTPVFEFRLLGYGEEPDDLLG